MKISFLEKGSVKKDFSLVKISKAENDQVLKLPSGIFQIVLGVEDEKKITSRKFFILARKVIALAKKNKIKKVAIKFSDFDFSSCDLSHEEIAENLMINFEMANYAFVKYKEKPKKGWDFVEEVKILGKLNRAEKQALKKGKIVGEGLNHCRELANTPAADMTPGVLLSEAKKLVKNKKVKLKVLDEKQMKKLRMGGVLSVGQGSKEPSKFIILEYLGAKSDKKPIVLVGKAVTFDSGGINIKPFEAMKDMQMDMSGGAATLQILSIAQKLKLKKNIIVLIPAVENMSGGGCYRQGDVVKTMSGKTIEVGHTDAEGRIILADALTYAERYKPRLVIDVATLTGAAMIALGSRASALYSSEKKTAQLLMELGERTGDFVWQMPLWEEYESEIKGTVGDVSNIGKYQKGGGANTAAAFLWQFAKKYSWVHVDIAPRMTSADDEFLEKGAAGASVRLLVKFLRATR